MPWAHLLLSFQIRHRTTSSTPARIGHGCAWTIERGLPVLAQVGAREEQGNTLEIHAL